jgi:hypothetical protein
MCPVCGLYEFEMDDNYEICTVCRWENDGLQLDEPNSTEGANEMSLYEARAQWAKRKNTIQTQPTYAAVV